MFIQADKNIYGENDSALKINNKASGAQVARRKIHLIMN